LGMFGSLKYFTPPLNQRYGNGTSARDYLEKAQVAAYESHRAMFEAYRRNKYVSTGIIQWMLNNPWPENIWHLFDYYFDQGGSYFGSKTANEPLHIQYSYDDDSVWVVNDYLRSFSDLKAVAQIVLLNSQIFYTHEFPVATVNPDSSMYLFKVPDMKNQGVLTYFVRLELINNTNNGVVSRNFYWLSTKPDVLNYAATTFFQTACSSYADMKDLQKLPQTNLNVSFVNKINGKTEQTIVTVSNAGDGVAFFVRLRVVKKGTDDDVLPNFWEDNYFSLLPKESREITVTYDVAALDGSQPDVKVELWNDISGSQLPQQSLLN